MTRHDINAALVLVANVLGIGVLFLPWTATALFGDAALAGWAYLVVAGAVLVHALTTLAGHPAADQGATGLAGRILGEPAGRAVLGFYAVGVSAGQAVVALVAAGFLIQATGAGAAAGWWIAMVVIVAGTVAAASGRSLGSGPWFAAVTLATVLGVLVAVVLLARPGGSAGPHPLRTGDVLAAAVLQLFVVVGWESTPGVTARTSGRRARGPLAGVALVGAVYAAVLFHAGDAASVRSAGRLALPDLGSGAGRLVAGIAAVVVAVLCARNLATAAVAAARAVTGRIPDPAARRSWSVTAGAVAVAAVTVVAIGRLDPIDVLSIPNTMALVVFLTVALCATVAGRRRAGAAALAVHVPLSVFAGPALALPLLIWGAAVGRAVPSTVRDNVHHRGEP